jgi:RecA/RadA recombinase
MDANERRKKLMETIKGFNKKNKSEVFTLGKEISSYGVNSIGIESIDNFIGGGFKRGGHTIVYGAYSVGKTALVLTTIANAQKEGKLVCYVNTEKPIDVERFEYFGINLEDMVYIEAPEDAEKALEALRTLCKGKVIDLFVIDSTNGLCPKSVQETSTGAERGLDKKNVASLPMTLSNFYNVVNAHVFRSKASVVWIGQTRTKGIGSFFAHQGLTGGNAQEFYAYQIIYLRKGQKSNNPVEKRKEYRLEDGKLKYKTVSDECGFSVVAKIIKTNSSKSAKTNQEIEIPYYDETGFYPLPERDMPITIAPDMTPSQKEEIIQILKEKGVLETNKENVEKEPEMPKKRGRKKKVKADTE